MGKEKVSIGGLSAAQKDVVFETNFLDYFSSFYILDVRALKRRYHNDHSKTYKDT
jgi:hypothetical protein